MTQRRPSSRYSRVFASFAAGLFLVVTGSIGWNVSHLHGLFAGGRWEEGPIWWQLGLGALFLILGAHWSRRVGDDRSSSNPRRIKHVGRGQA